MCLFSKLSELEFREEWRRNFSRSLTTWKCQIAVILIHQNFFCVHNKRFLWRIKKKVWKSFASGSATTATTKEENDLSNIIYLFYLLSIAVIHSISESMIKSNQYLNLVYWWFYLVQCTVDNFINNNFHFFMDFLVYQFFYLDFPHTIDYSRRRALACLMLNM